MDIEVVGSLAFGDDGKPCVDLGDPIVGDLGRSGGENRLEDDLGLGVSLAELFEGLRNVGQNVQIAQSPFQIIDSCHDIDRAGIRCGKVCRSHQYAPCCFPRNALV